MDITHPQMFLNSHRFYSLNRVLPLLVCHCYPEILNPISSTCFDNMNNSFQLTRLYSERCSELCGFANFRILISDPFFLFLAPHRGRLEVTYNVQPFKNVDSACSDA